MKLLIFSIFLLHLQVIVTAEEPIFVVCYNSSTYNSGSPFEANLKSLLSSLPGLGLQSFDSFYDTAIGSPDTVYGFSQCMSGASEGDCRQCLINSTVEIVRRCPNRTQAAIRYYNCVLRYSDQRLLSQPDSTVRFASHWTRNVSMPMLFRKSMYRLVEEVSSDPFRNGTQTISGLSPFPEIYGLAQCTKDLSKTDCSACLGNMVGVFEDCCLGGSGGNAYSVSCNIRYETSAFFSVSESTPPEVAASPPTQAIAGERKKKPTTIIIISSVAAFIVVIIFLSTINKFLWRKKRRHRGMSLFHDTGALNGSNFMDGDIDGGDQVDDHGLPLISLSVVQTATNNFSDKSLLGRGGFGPVYKGLLPNGKEIAVKRLSRTSGQGLEEFKNEIILIAKLQHRNLVRLFGCCIGSEEKLLVYEYMPNTSLDVFLFDSIKRVQLDWRTRIQIIGGISRGLLYLHEDSCLRIIHRDLKASNILLDNEMNPKISDFGMARIFGGNQNEGNTNRVVGTYGYMAPEYAMAGLFSVKSDVFSFGVLLLEIVSGKRNTSQHLPGHAQSLLAYAWRLWCDGKGMELMDDLIQETSSASEASEVLRCIHIGLLCVQEDPADRPNMSSVVVMLTNDSMALPEPTNPGFFLGRVVAESNQALDNASKCSVNEVTISVLDAR